MDEELQMEGIAENMHKNNAQTLTNVRAKLAAKNGKPVEDFHQTTTCKKRCGASCCERAGPLSRQETFVRQWRRLCV